MKTDKEYVDFAVAEHQGQRLPLGAVVAHPDISIAMELVAYEEAGEVAVLEYAGDTRRVPAAEIFDPNAATTTAVSRKLAARASLN